VQTKKVFSARLASKRKKERKKGKVDRFLEGKTIRDDTRTQSQH